MDIEPHPDYPFEFHQARQIGTRMSQWHRANPALCGTDADLSMLNEPYRLARDELLAEGLIYATAQEASACPVEGCAGPDLSWDGNAIGCGLKRRSEDCPA